MVKVMASKMVRVVRFVFGWLVIASVAMVLQSCGGGSSNSGGATSTPSPGPVGKQATLDGFSITCDVTPASNDIRTTIYIIEENGDQVDLVSYSGGSTQGGFSISLKTEDYTGDGDANTDYIFFQLFSNSDTSTSTYIFCEKNGDPYGYNDITEPFSRDNRLVVTALSGTQYEAIFTLDYDGSTFSVSEIVLTEILLD